MKPCVSAAGRLKEALQAALSYLLFHKEEEFVTENVEYYREVLGHDGQPREVSISCRFMMPSSDPPKQHEQHCS